jgi:catalase
MHGFGSHTFSLVSAEGVRSWVKFHFKSLQGIRNLAPAEAERLAGTDPDYVQRDLFNAIDRGEFPKWRMCIQVMTNEQAASRAQNPFDVTKTWSQRKFPLIEVGVLELNRNPQNYFAEVERAAFAPSNVVPGVGLSPDPRPYAARPRVRICRRASLSDWNQSSAVAGECAALPLPALSARWGDAFRWQWRFGAEL